MFYLKSAGHSSGDLVEHEDVRTQEREQEVKAREEALGARPLAYYWDLLGL